MTDEQAARAFLQKKHSHWEDYYKDEQTRLVDAYLDGRADQREEDAALCDEEAKDHAEMASIGVTLKIPAAEKSHRLVEANLKNLAAAIHRTTGQREEETTDDES